MDNHTHESYFAIPLVGRPDLPDNQRALYRFLATILLYNSITQVLTGIGMIAIFILGAAGYLDIRENNLLIIAAINLINAGLHIPYYSLLRRLQLQPTALGIFITNVVVATLQIFLWGRVAWFPAGIVLFFALTFLLQRDISLLNKLIIVLTTIGMQVLIWTLDAQLAYPRISLSYLNNMAALTLQIAFSVLMLLLSILTSQINFRTIASRLIVIFTTTVIFSATITLVISTLANFFQGRQRVFDQLQIISDLKKSEIQTFLSNSETQASQPLNDDAIRQRIQFLLQSEPQQTAYQINLVLVNAYLQNLQKQGLESEILLLGADGKAILSTINENQGADLSAANFFQNAQKGIFHQFFDITTDFPGAGNTKSFLALKPIIKDNQLLGMLVFRTDFNSLGIPLSEQSQTLKTSDVYLIGRINDKIVPLTATKSPAAQINTLPAQKAFQTNANQGSGIYPNYAGTDVLGNYVWLPQLQAALVVEIAQQAVLAGISRALLVNALIGILSISLVFVIIFTTAQTISLPIVELAQKAAALASGDFSTRVPGDRDDEIGKLGISFNQMAGRLQEFIKTLEGKVEDRTEDLQKQANYLRIASEVARDATTAQNLDELLNNAAQLILNRFGFYHTGIFLIDPQREYAVLRASPTQAGAEMLASGHRLKVGQVGIVGYVSATGLPRIALDTGQDAAYFNNPFLPRTRSEAALPLKLNQEIIGVLDVQSEHPEAFTQEDIATLQIMADQLAMAIQRVQLIDDLQKNYQELQKAYQRFTGESWEQLGEEPNFQPGYKFDGVNITPLNAFPEKIQTSLAGGKTVVIPSHTEQTGERTTVAAPLKLREQVIGVLSLQFNTPIVAPETITLIEETAARLAVALENARLYAETQKLAQRERTVSEISSRITASFNIETILRTAVAEIGKMLPDAEVAVQLQQNKD